VNWKRATIGVAGAAPVIAFLAYGLTRDPNEIPSPLPGRSAPSFALSVFAPGEGALARPMGDTISLDRMRGKIVVLNFWASWCLACLDEHTALSETARAFAGRPVQFAGVLYNDVARLGTDWIAARGGQSYPSLVDPGARTAIDYGLYGVPETFIIDGAGRVAYKHTGPISSGLLAHKLDSLLSLAVVAPSPAPGLVKP
jgi:cytochrome c biogenesis protein CcmG/thiol:disulfide interchange protein DsbE